MTKDKLISLIAEYKKELYGKATINLLKELDLPTLEKEFIKEALCLLQIRASREFADLMKNNYKKDYKKLKEGICEISVKSNILNRFFELKVEELPSPLEMAILLTEHNILDILWKEYANDHINVNIANFSYVLSLLVKSIEKNKSTYYADITLKSHSTMDKPIYLSINGNCENMRSTAIAKIKETIPKDIDQGFECYINFYFKHLIEDKTVFDKTEAYQLTVKNSVVSFLNITY